MPNAQDAYLHGMLEPDSNRIRSPSDASVIRISNFINSLNSKYEIDQPLIKAPPTSCNDSNAAKEPNGHETNSGCPEPN